VNKSQINKPGEKLCRPGPPDVESSNSCRNSGRERLADQAGREIGCGSVPESWAEEVKNLQAVAQLVADAEEMSEEMRVTEKGLAQPRKASIGQRELTLTKERAKHFRKEIDQLSKKISSMLKGMQFEKGDSE